MRNRDALIYSFILNKLKEENKLVFLAKSIDKEDCFHNESIKYEDKDSVRLELQLFGLEIQRLKSNEDNLVSVKGTVLLNPSFYKLPDEVNHM